MKLRKLPTRKQVPEYIVNNEFVYKIYKEVCNDLLSRDLLYRADLPFIQAYATSLFQYQDITIRLLDPDNLKEDVIYKDHNKQIRQHPLSRLQRNYLDSINTTAKLLGISPYFRTRTKGSETKEAKTRTLASIGNALNG